MTGASATYFGGVVYNFFMEIQERKYQRLQLKGKILDVKLVQSDETLDRLSKKGRTVRSVKPPDGITHCAAILDLQSDRFDPLQRDRLKMLARIVLNLKNRETVLVCLPYSRRIKSDIVATILKECGLDEVAIYGTEVGLDEGTTMHGPPAEEILEQQDALLERLEQGMHQTLVVNSSNIRGLDIRNVSHVVTFGLDQEDIGLQYSHIAGRTGRMGKKGTVITIVDKDEWEKVLPFVEHLHHCKICEWNLEKSEANFDRVVDEYEDPMLSEVASANEFQFLRRQRSWQGRRAQRDARSPDLSEDLIQEAVDSAPAMKPWKERASSRKGR